MTAKEIDERLAELNKEVEELINAKHELKNKNFERLTENVMKALRELINEFPHCEWTLCVETAEGDENIDILSRSDILDGNYSSQD